jgi:hypothetical protein
MPEVVFGSQSGSAPAPVVEETKQVVNTPVADVKVETTTTHSVPATQGATNAFRLGDRLPGFKDVTLPRLNIVYSVGELGKSFAAGSIVFGKETILYTPMEIDKAQGVITKPALPPVTIYVLGIVSERFSEKIKGGMGGEIVDTEAEVRAAGGTLDYKEWNLKKGEGMRRFEPLVELLVAIEKPAHVNDGGAVFGFDVGDKKFTIGFWSCKGSAYTEAVKGVFNTQRLMGVLRGGYYTHAFALTTKSKLFKLPDGSFEAPIPVARPLKPTPPDVLEFIKNIVQPVSS